ADQNTYAVLGEAVAGALRHQNFDLKTVVFTNAEVVADAHHIMRVLVEMDPQARTMIAVGSGTITDITRFVSHRTRNRFVSMPTAPSVDGFASIGAPLIIGGVKTTVIAHAPQAIFADINVLTAAPRAMIAAGFGDMLGKITSIADWRLGRLLWDEPYDETIAERTLQAAQRCIDQAAAIGAGTPAGIRILMEALIESGYCMLDFGSSRPASGSEHHYSHVWEMKLLRENRPAILHGAKVGVATVLVAGVYEQIRQWSRQAVADLLESAELPDRTQEMAQIEAAYGHLAADILQEQAPFLNLSTAAYATLKQKILDQWPEIQAIAAQVPTAQDFGELLQQVHGPTTVQALGLTAAEQILVEQNAHYLRNRFTVRKLNKVLNPPRLSIP
ncbi:MAG: sn-glycerol-1-phosphate dehydrogenase, partial [Chloroflexi bacterium]|nr:sn-glycerol-1-phosphate dehydrogenase [Chloroflexota bacterium]